MRIDSFSFRVLQTGSKSPRPTVSATRRLSHHNCRFEGPSWGPLFNVGTSPRHKTTPFRLRIQGPWYDPFFSPVSVSRSGITTFTRTPLGSVPRRCTNGKKRSSEGTVPRQIKGQYDEREFLTHV